MWPCGLTFLFVKPADAAAVVVRLEQQLSEELPQMDGLAGVAHLVWPGVVVGFCEGLSESVTVAIQSDIPEMLQLQTRIYLIYCPLEGSAPSLQQLKNRSEEPRELLPPLIKMKQVWFVCTFICTCYAHYIKVYAWTYVWLKLLLIPHPGSVGDGG